jgi:hypothetical protein
MKKLNTDDLDFDLISKVKSEKLSSPNNKDSVNNNLVKVITEK